MAKNNKIRSELPSNNPMKRNRFSGFSDIITPPDLYLFIIESQRVRSTDIPSCSSDFIDRVFKDLSQLAFYLLTIGIQISE